MTGQLLGRKLLARAFGTPSPLVETKLVCDTEATGPARVTYEIGFPDEGLPGWTQTRSPGATLVTALLILSTVPATSCPRVSGKRSNSEIPAR